MGARFSVQKAVRMAVLVAVAMLFSYVESLFPLPVPAPGIKLGLANAAVLAAMGLLGTKEAFAVSMVRVALSGILFSTPFSTLYSLAGALLSFGVMALLWRCTRLSLSVVSVSGAVAHNVAQTALAALLLGTPQLFAYLPVLLCAGILTGLLTGTSTTLLLRHIKPLAGAQRPGI